MSRGQLMVTNPYSKLLAAYPRLCFKLGIIPKGKVTYNNPQSWPIQDIALPQHTWELRNIAVWNTAARVHLKNQNPRWLRDFASDVQKAKWIVIIVCNGPILNARHAVMPGIGKCEKLLLDKKQVVKVTHKTATDISAPILCQSNPKAPAQSCRLEVLGIRRRQLPGSGWQNI
eukprot:1141746-Pelagomonas_calceolata.AAC.1